MLVIDNGSGKIDNISQIYSEYYGGTAGIDGLPGQKLFEHGFAALAEDDSDGNGVIDSADPIWAKLRVWQDISHNGQVDEGELKTLDEWGSRALMSLQLWLAVMMVRGTRLSLAGCSPSMISSKRFWR